MSERALHVTVVSTFAVTLPAYIIFGLQPSLPADAAFYPTLEAPDISLSTPVQPLELVDHRLDTPATIAGAYSRHEGKTLIIGHSSTVFKNLSKLDYGSILTYAERSFIVTDIHTREKSSVDMQDILSPARRDTIILMTCAGDPLPGQDATHRLVITAELYQGNS